MKKVFIKLVLIILITANSSNVIAQNDNSFPQKNINELFYGHEFEQLNKLMLDLQNKPNFKNDKRILFWSLKAKAELYFLEVSNPTFKNSIYGIDAFNTFLNYETFDSNYSLISDKETAWRPLDVIYVNSFTIGRSFFESKQWDSSLVYFKQAAYLGDIITKLDLRKNGGKIDTLSTVYAGYAAQNTKSQKEATYYYKKIADNKLNSHEFLDCYQYILVYYSDQKEIDQFYKYYGIAKMLFPQENWKKYEEYFNK
jgi:hypothetical protein